MPFKPLIQAKNLGGDEQQMFITLLIDIPAMEQVIAQAKASEDKRASVILNMDQISTQLTLELQEPGKAKNLVYTENLKKDDRTVIVVATI